ncbi:unnamed protein product [Candida verbasci]|uniref:Programmed cell death protein 5 n=1 Tax=Candida verbasci TaxID=1227364 RepID=A0A9W4XEW3_9ASCO|nr:unnamed protein product [Candida verbasci]
MDDAELNAIRQARLAELQNKTNGGGGGGNNNNKESSTTTNNNYNDLTLTILNRILETEARERLSRVRIVRPDRAQSVENYILKLYQMGQINRKLQEKDVVEILDGISRDEKQKQQSKIVYNRKHTDDYDDDDDDVDDFFD